MPRIAIAPLVLWYLIAAFIAVLLPVSVEAVSVSSKVPNDIVLVLDNSGSMRKNDKNVVTKQVAAQFIRDAAANSHLAILIFDTNVKFAFRLAPATGASREALLASLDNLDYRGRWTNMPAALSQAMAELKTNGRDSAAKSIVLLTDGVVETGNAERDREDSLALRRVLASDAASNGVRVFTVALGPKADTELLQVLANQTFADYYWVAAGDDLPPAFERIHTTIVQDARLPTLAKAQVPVQGVQMDPSKQSTAKLPGSPGASATGMIEPDAVSRIVPVAPSLAPKRDRVPRPPVPAPAGDGTPQRVATGNGLSTPANWSWTVGGLLLLVGILSGLLLRGNTAAVPTVATVVHTETVPPKTARPGTVQRMPQAFLQDMSGVTGRPRHELDNAVTVIGRLAPHPDDPFGHLVIDQPTIGRRHAVIERRQHGYWVSDQHSKNGTFVNDQRITDEVSLSHGDKLRFHEYDFEFFLAGWGLVDETVSVSDLRLVSNNRPEAQG